LKIGSCVKVRGRERGRFWSWLREKSRAINGLHHFFKNQKLFG